MVSGPPVRVADLAAALEACGAVRVVAGSPSDPGVPDPGPAELAVEVRGATLDSRSVAPGDLYAALPGARAHGADFAAAALAAGAAAVLTDADGAERVLAATGGAPGAPLLVVADPRAVLGDLAARVHRTGRHRGGRPGPLLLGVTGTNGKTTTAHLLEGAMRALGRTTGLVGTVETRVAGQVVASARTTPEAPALHALLDRMAERGVDVAAMEVSSHALALHRVDGVVLDVAAFTNLSQDHLDFHPGMEEYFAVKASLFTPERSRRGVVCVDDEWGRRLAGQAGVPVVTVGTRPDARSDARSDVGTDAAGPRSSGGADWSAREVRADAAGSDFVLVGRDGARLRLRAPLPGAFNVANTAVAAVVLLEAGLTAADVVTGLSRAGSVPGRMEVVEPLLAGGSAGAVAEDLPRVVVDYAHTPDAVAAALAALRPSTAGRLVVVLGAGGDRDRGKRAGMGRAAASGADVVVVTDDNPRSEDPAAIRAAVLAGALDGPGSPGSSAGPAAAGPARPRAGTPEVAEVADRARALAAALAAAGADGTVLVAGKGHERGQEVDGVVHPFDDREQARAALAVMASDLGRDRGPGQEPGRGPDQDPQGAAQQPAPAALHPVDRP